MNIALINTNRIKPSIAPIGLEYVAETLISAGFQVDLLDLCWVEDYTEAISGFFSQKEYALIGLSLRNTDDCAYTNRQSFLPEFCGIVQNVRNATDAMIVIGGVGFSTMPEVILNNCEADAGIWGDGEFAFRELAERIAKGERWYDVPGLLFNQDGLWLRNAPETYPLERLPVMQRTFCDNQRYFKEGGQIGFETKRGCDCKCIYCADPVAKGNTFRCRPPEAVVDELESLLGQNIDHFHTCDCEFNLPAWHAVAVCEEIIKRNLGSQLHWYAYCTPKTFAQNLAELMKNAGCAGINFGVDSGDAGMLVRLKRGFTPDDIMNTARYCRTAGITSMFDLLLGAPEETKESITHTIELMKQAEPDRVGVSIGVRVYPYTEMEDMVTKGQLTDGLVKGGHPLEPLFYLDPQVGSIIHGLLDDLIGDDPRFLFFNPENPRKNYNYNANQVLVEAIGNGSRGAYWDILRRIG